MSQQEGTPTERLVSVIQAIQIGRRTGLLTVRRGEGRATEEGAIFFTKGQVTQANAGRRSRSEALNWLSTWGACRYFFATDTTESPLIITTPTSPPSRQVTSELPSQSDTASRPSYLAPITEPLNTAETPQHSTIPQRSQPPETALRLIEQSNLSRVHRQLFLLIDGQRSGADFARLMRRNETEVKTILQELAQVGVIQFIHS